MIIQLWYAYVPYYYLTFCINACLCVFMCICFPFFRFLIEATRSNPDHADFESLIESIQIGCKTICNLLARSAIHYESDISTSSLESGNLDSVNNTRRLYDKASAIIKNSLKFTGMGIA